MRARNRRQLSILDESANCSKRSLGSSSPVRQNYLATQAFLDGSFTFVCFCRQCYDVRYLLSDGTRVHPANRVYVTDDGVFVGIRQVGTSHNQAGKKHLWVCTVMA